MLESVPIGSHADNYFGEPEFIVPADARRRHMALFGGTGTGKSTLLTNMAASDLVSGSGITVVDSYFDRAVVEIPWTEAQESGCRKIFVTNLLVEKVARELCFYEATRSI